LASLEKSAKSFIKGGRAPCRDAVRKATTWREAGWCATEDIISGEGGAEGVVTIKLVLLPTLPSPALFARWTGS